MVDTLGRASFLVIYFSVSVDCTNGLVDHKHPVWLILYEDLGLSLKFYNPLFFFLNVLLDPRKPLLWLSVHLFSVTAYMDMALWGHKC